MKRLLVIAFVLVAAAIASAAAGNRHEWVSAPGNWIDESQIEEVPEGVLISGKMTLARIEGTDSMLPVLDASAHALLVPPGDKESIHEGDIIAYTAKEAGGIVAHRVIGVGKDEHGWYARAKGDSAGGEDPEKVRFEDINYVVAGILY